MTRPLPQPTRERWQPLRCGLIDLFYYDAEEFWFHDGRLLLRGNNGTGKSKVLALTLPFLLDGELSPHRVEPDADPKKRMEWNLLLGGAHPFPERLGYTWLELGRITEDGTPAFRTLGCGMKAVSGRGIARHWFFLTTQRPGGELGLVDATGVALPRDRLADALGEHGTVFETARAYRRAVDEALFGLGEQRYGALVDLLVQLRQPQLSKRPSERALSDALTEALPPLDQALLADVAEAFHSLEEDRDALAGLIETQQAAGSFLGHYRRYARIASRRRAGLPRRAQSAYEAVNDSMREAERQEQAAQQELDTAAGRLAELDLLRGRLRARDEALRASPEMRSQQELTRAAETARGLAETARHASTEASKAGQRRENCQRKHDQAQDSLATAQAELPAARSSTLDMAAGALVDQPHRAAIDAQLDEAADEQVVARLRQEADGIISRQDRAIRRVEALCANATRAGAAVVSARGVVEDLAAQQDDLGQRRADAAMVMADRGAELVAQTREHVERAVELHLPDPAATLAELELWVDTLDGPNPGRVAAESAAHAAASRIAAADAELAQRERAHRDRISELDSELAGLERGDHTAPPAPHTRDQAARAQRAGAPLWQLTDFADSVSAADRAGLEAALEASGILDAWVTPDGDLISAGTSDVLLSPGSAARPAASLSGVLVPAVDRDDPRAGAVSDHTVAAALAAIGHGEHGETWVGSDGRFRIGVLTGRWAKPAAAYIGRGAREAARRERIATLRAQRAQVESALTGIMADRSAMAARRDTLSAELAALPGDEALRAAHTTMALLAREQAALTGRRATADQALTDAVTEANQAHAELVDTAGELGLPAGETELAAVRAALTEYRLALAELWPAVRAVLRARRGVAETATELDTAVEDEQAAAERAVETTSEAQAAQERHQTLLETVGTAVELLQRQLVEVADHLRDNAGQRKATKAAQDNALRAHGRATGRKEELAGKLQEATRERAEATESLRRFARTGLLAVALPGLPVPDPDGDWAPSPTVLLARQIDRELAEVTDDDAAWERTQRKVTEEFKTLLDTLTVQGDTAVATLLDDGIVVDVMFRGRSTTVPELAEALVSEVADRQRLLDERERVILENHLVNEVASTLQELISEAERQVALMNSELADRPTSTGMRLRLLWQPREDGPAGLDAARDRLLRQTADAWSESDRAAVGGFLQARINDVRLSNPTGTWLEHLTAALDYRQWNRFVIQRHQNGQWRSATGPASGGERVLAASVPLFAAASAHYASAGNPHAPRLVTLDEAFAGVDDNARAKYLGLLAAFDLDVVLTSEREWGCYPEVPGLAIAQLSRSDDVAAVLVTNWRWDGRMMTEQPRPDPRPAMLEGLWGDS